MRLLGRVEPPDATRVGPTPLSSRPVSSTPVWDPVNVALGVSFGLGLGAWLVFLGAEQIRAYVQWESDCGSVSAVCAPGAPPGGDRPSLPWGEASSL